MAMGSRAPMMAASPRWFSESRRLMAIKPVVLADIGEGKITIHASPVLSVI